ncbi:MAG: hypothetical protein H6706_08260 [Myxococcales bacterium]|nr:hypothetical protein [Myxococcales bacterium]
MSKTDLESLRKRADALHRRYLAHYAGQPRISRDPKALQLMVREADELTGALRRLPAAQQMQLARVLRENRDLYAQEVKAIQQAQAGGDEALYAHHLANQAAVTSGRYRRSFAGHNRATRDVGLLTEMIGDLERLAPLMEEQLTRIDSSELKQALTAARENLGLYQAELAEIRTAQTTGEPDQRGDILASVANSQFGLYRDHFAGRSRLSRRPGLLVRMIENLEATLAAMRGITGIETNDRNAEIVAGRLQAWNDELAQIRAAKAGTQLAELVSALGEAANGIFEEYRAGFAGQDRKTRDLDLLNRLVEGLIDIARQMEDIDRVRDDATNRSNLGIVLDHIRLYDREFELIREAQKAAT